MKKRTKALAIPKEVKERVWERDKGCCVWCGSPHAAPNAHFIARSHSGLGIEENILTLCPECHREFDQGSRGQRENMKIFFRAYLKVRYPDWDEENLVYRREL